MTEQFLNAKNLRYEWHSRDLFSREPSRTLWDIPTLELSQSGIVLLAGRNGSGKSTLIRCLLGLIRPTHGTIRWFNSESTPQGKIGYLPELPVLPARVRVSELIESLLGLDAQAIAQLEAKTPQINSLRISELWNRPAYLLSKGQQQRLLLKLALAGAPRGFVLDEPFSGLDPWARAELAETLCTLAAQGHFIILSSHDAPQRLRAQVRETWIIENNTLTCDSGCVLPE